MRAANRHLAVRMWAIGHEPGDHVPLTIVLGLAFCKAHVRQEIESRELLTDELFRQVEDVCRRSKVALPDRETAELVERRGVPDERLLMGALQRRAHRQGGKP